VRHARPAVSTGEGPVPLRCCGDAALERHSESSPAPATLGEDTVPLRSGTERSEAEEQAVRLRLVIGRRQ
jgi:hypothetical protein